MMELKVRFVPMVLAGGGALLLLISAFLIRPMFATAPSSADFLASFVAIQFASFMATTSLLNGWRFYRLGIRNKEQDRFAMMLMGLMGFALFVLIVAWLF